MKVKVKKFHENAKLPVKAHPDDFCYDVWAVSEEEIAPNVWKYGLGFGIAMDGYDEDAVAISMRLAPRSSVYKTGMVLANSEGIVDFGYTNEISMIFYHVFINMPRYKVGDKLGQMYVAVTDKELDFEFVDELPKTERGMGGFGSSDK